MEEKNNLDNFEESKYEYSEPVGDNSAKDEETKDEGPKYEYVEGCDRPTEKPVKTGKTYRKKPNVFVRILTTLICLVLCLILTVGLLVTPIVDSTRRIFTFDTAQKIVSQIDFECAAEALINLEGMTGDEKEYVELIKKIVSSDLFENTAEVYVLQLLYEARGMEAPEAIDEDSIYNLLNEYRDELIKVLVPEEEINAVKENYSDAEFNEIVDGFIKEYSQGIYQSLPDSKSIVELVSSYGSAFDSLVTGVITLCFALFCLFNAFLIFVLKLWKRKGLIYLAICFAFSGIIVTACGLITKTTNLILNLFGGQESVTSYMVPLIKPVINTFSNSVVIYGIIYFVLMIALIVWNVIYVKGYKKAMEE